MSTYRFSPQLEQRPSSIRAVMVADDIGQYVTVDRYEAAVAQWNECARQLTATQEELSTLRAVYNRQQPLLRRLQRMIDKIRKIV